MTNFIGVLRTINQLLTAGIAITAFSLLLYSLSFNLRDRVARSFAIIMVCVVIVFVGEAIGSISNTPKSIEIWFKVQWSGLVFLPPAYLHFSDALLATTGKPSRGRRRLVVWLNYIISIGFLNHHQPSSDAIFDHWCPGACFRCLPLYVIWFWLCRGA
jgi:hypothetical protein